MPHIEPHTLSHTSILPSHWLLGCIGQLRSIFKQRYVTEAYLAVENSFSFTVQCERSSCLNEGGGGASSPALAFLAKASPR
eukprot:scaffold174483_cov28-Tisochrysis_lutea.AAC.2